MRIIKNIFIVVVAAFVYGCQDNQMPFQQQYDQEANLARERPLIDDYLAKTPYDSLYRIHDPSGVVIIVQEEGEGSRPKNGTIVYTNYVGKLTDGTVFEANTKAAAEEHGLHTETSTYSVLSFTVTPGGQGSGFIAGFSIGFKRIRSGSKAVIIIPSPYGYQDRAVGGIPANSILVFEVDFLGID